MKRTLFIFLLAILITGCSKDNTMEDVFHKEMKELKDVDDYRLVKEVEEDHIILFTSYTKGDEQNNNHLQIVHFNKVNNDWVWDKTTSCNGKWSALLESKPYIWCGTLTEPRHEKVYVGDNEAKMIEVDVGAERVWYHLSVNENEDIKVVLTDGSEEWLKEVKK
ncbi:hypothetical protein ACFSCX_15595 [Bacillus salitolerans]|uniref:Lipoprotein n=1 Tax=Bacillus salitolerans TaxID=1437434 RepID=A0ABW4LS10_9BACI